MNEKNIPRSEAFDPNAPATAPQAPVNQPPQDQQSVLQDTTEDLSSFLSVDNLPTGCKYYPEGTKIIARPMKVTEVKMLSQMAEDTADDTVNEIIKRCVRGIEVQDLYATDKLFLIFWLRANTYTDSGYEVQFECPKCNKLTTYNFGMDKLRIKSFDEVDVKSLEDGAILSNGDRIKFKFLKVRDEQDNVKFLKMHKKSLMNFDEEILGVCRMIHTINDEEKGMIDKYMYLTEKISAPDYAYVESFIQDISVGLEPIIDVQCNSCGGASETTLPFRPDFFLPKVKTGRNS